MNASSKKVRSAHTRPPQTVYNNGMKRRSNLTKDILAVLAEGPCPIGIIATRIEAKRNSIKSVVWKLLKQQKIGISHVGDAISATGPKRVNVYCLVTQPSE